MACPENMDFKKGNLKLAFHGNVNQEHLQWLLDDLCQWEIENAWQSLVLLKKYSSKKSK